METTKRKPHIGDLAWHKAGYDPREVTRVEGPFIGLYISDEVEAWPCPIENYNFTKVVRDD